jgi:hypothetical protein
MQFSQNHWIAAFLFPVLSLVNSLSLYLFSFAPLILSSLRPTLPQIQR